MNKHPMVVLWLLWQLSFFIVCSNSTLVKDGTGTCEKSTIHLRKLGGPGCPYTASWLVHVNLYRTVRYWTDITKMEAASFTMFERALLKFQFADHDAYYVHHMSLYEHVNHKAHGFEVAKNKSMEMARAAVEGECSAQLKPDKRSQTVALIPFYGGLPPNVTKDLSVKSLGQGNSLMDASTKALQALATACSCLKYFGNVVVGVARDDDRTLMLKMIQRLKIHVRSHINVIQFRVGRPSYLPFHLLAWGHYFIRYHNCQRYYKPAPRAAGTVGLQSNMSAIIAANIQWLGFEEGEIDLSLIPKHSSELEICQPQSFQPHVGSPIQVLFQRKSASFIQRLHERSGGNERLLPSKPIQFVYYSECDQIVRFDCPQTLQAMQRYSNATTFFSGRRKVKSADSPPGEYMRDFNAWRDCGDSGYKLDVNSSNHYVEKG